MINKTLFVYSLCLKPTRGTWLVDTFGFSAVTCSTHPERAVVVQIGKLSCMGIKGLENA